MRVVNCFPQGTKITRGKAIREALLDGRIFELVRGIDFNVSPSQFRAQMRALARRKGLDINSTITGNVVTIQAVKLDGKSEPVITKVETPEGHTQSLLGLDLHGSR